MSVIYVGSGEDFMLDIVSGATTKPGDSEWEGGYSRDYEDKLTPPNIWEQGW